jgi:hypothetical protein
MAIHAAAAVDVNLDGQQTVKAHASQIIYMKHGLAMVIAMMVLTFQPTTVVMNAQQVLQFGLIVTSLIVMVVTAIAMVEVIQQVLAVLVQVAR